MDKGKSRNQITIDHSFWFRLIVFFTDNVVYNLICGIKIAQEFLIFC